MSSLSQRVAHTLLRHRLRWLLTLFVLVISSLVFLTSRIQLDTEVLNLLPGNFESVKGLKAYNSRFAQTRLLTFAIIDKDPDKVEALQEALLLSLPEQPWVLRFFDRPPIETPEGLADLQGVAVPLLLNLPADEFAAAVALLDPEKIASRLQRLRREIDAGSPTASVSLSLDPLGLLTRAMRPLAGVTHNSQRDALASEDGTLRLFFVETTQKNIGAIECQRIMAEVHDFIEKFRNAHPGNDTPEILVTGRTPYVAEISQGMHSDLTSSLLGSVLFCCALFYLGFKRLLPLAAILAMLGVTCLLALAAAVFLFGSVNVITIGFCSIVVGLGIDFGMLHFSRYRDELSIHQDPERALAISIREVSPSVFYGAATSAIAFLALLLSEAPGFGQLGVLVALGIVLAALLMGTLLYLLLPLSIAPKTSQPDLFERISRKYIDLILRQRRSQTLILYSSVVIFLAAIVWAVLPIQSISYSANPASLEPRNSLASQAMQRIKEKMPAAREPMLAVGQAATPQEFHDLWAAAETRWRPLVDQGVIDSFSTPAPFAISPRRLQENWTTLHALDLAASERSLAQAIETEGFSRPALQPAFDLLRRLADTVSAPPALPDWKTAIPETSPWWFLINRYLSDEPLFAAAFINLKHPVTQPSERDALAAALTLPDHSLQLTGWAYTLVDLIPWAARELTLLLSSVGALVALLLALSHRQWKAWSLSILSILFSSAAIVATLKILHVELNLLNILSFPLVLGVGVDYGIHALVALRKKGDPALHLMHITKPLLLCGLTTVAGFGSLITCSNPSLRGLGIICAVGVGWSILSTFLFLIPAYVRQSRPPVH